MAEGKFETAFDELEQIIQALEEGSLSLDHSLEQYEKGVKALQTCHRILDDAEKKIEILTRDSRGDLKARPFENPEDEET